jgi:uncharacterized protein (TIGR00159 family)
MICPTDLTGISDSIILTALIYLFSLMIRRDVALRLLGVMGVLVAFSLIARLSGFTPLIRVVDAIVLSMPVILALIFQNDLRRALLMLGKPQQQSDTRTDDSAVDEVLRALADLASRQIGALIVVVRQQPIEHLIQVGTDIDAKVTSELLNSIFLPYSPIHDGAVILHKNKITRAGCLLPLSHNPDIAKSFGTRHRAALGLSELSDALVLVVSEETGKISAVHDGKITYDIATTDLKRLLKKSMDHHTQRS